MTKEFRMEVEEVLSSYFSNEEKSFLSVFGGTEPDVRTYPTAAAGRAAAGSPAGTTDNSPAIHRWGGSAAASQSRRDDRNQFLPSPRLGGSSFVPMGLPGGRRWPSDE